MENSKSKKPRTIQMKYPAPYSHSFTSTDPLMNAASKMKKSTSFIENKRRIIQPQSCWTCPKPITRGCDPYAPHLKYGVFPRQTRRFSKVQISQKDPDPKNILIIKNHLLRDGKKNIKKGQSSDTPLFLIRPIDQSFTRQLSTSGVMHVDIKPHSAGNKLEYKNISPNFSTSRFLRNKTTK